MKEKIVLIDDELDLLKNTANILKKEGYQVYPEPTGQGGLKRIRDILPDLILLDIKLPDTDGFHVCRETKADPKTRHIPVLMISVISEEIDVVLGLELGAEDYIIKPFRKRELIARIKAALRRRHAQEKPVILEKGGIRVDTSSYTASAKGEPIPLTPKELQLLAFFLKREGQVITRSTISEEVWGLDMSSTSRTIDVHVDQLRKKLGSYGVEIAGLKGIGYRFLIEE